MLDVNARNRHRYFFIYMYMEYVAGALFADRV